MRIYINIGFLGLLLIFSSCATEVELDDNINISTPFILTSKTINPETRLTLSTSETLEVNSEKWKK
jgi:hypothetical protein